MRNSPTPDPENNRAPTYIFIGWSGETSQKMANLLKEKLPLFLRNIDIFVSDDIASGKRWDAKIAEALSRSKFGILCLTPDNLFSHWIHYEAGALSKTVDDNTYVCPLLLNNKKSDLKDPLSTFQACLFEENDFQQLIKTISIAAQERLDDSNIEKLMELIWPSIEKEVARLRDESAKTLPKETKSGIKQKLDIDTAVEELVERMRKVTMFMETLKPQAIEGLEVGEIKGKFKTLEARVDKQNDEMKEQQERINRIVKYTMSASTYRHLWHLHQGKLSKGPFEYLYNDNEPFRREMYFLRDHGYIKPVNSMGFLDFNQTLDKKNLVEIVDLTPIGYDYVAIRGTE